VEEFSPKKVFLDTLGMKIVPKINMKEESIKIE
jgi:hypothetical protein